MTGSGKKIKSTLTEQKRVPVLHPGMREASAGTITKIDVGSRPLGQFMVPGNEVGMKMSFNDVLDLQSLLRGCVQVYLNIALRIDYCCNCFGTNEVRGV